jgi:cytochrome c biogenesis protein CcmG, thiol:disulfide interchange protein DsbE
MKQKKYNWPLILALSFAGLCFLGCLVLGVVVALAPKFYTMTLENSSLKTGTSAPDFALTRLTGESVHLGDFKGQPVLLTFGATWCPDCRKEVPLLNDLHETHPELVILLVDSKESIELVQAYAAEMQITHPILLDPDGKVSEQYRVFAIPTELFIDANGMIRAKIIEQVTPELLAEYLPLIGINP